MTAIAVGGLWFSPHRQTDIHTDISWSDYLSGHRAYIFRPIYSYGMWLDQVTLVSISAVYKPVIVSIPLAHDRICIHSNRRNQCMHIHHLHKVQLTMLHHIPVNIQTIRHRHNVHKGETRTKSLCSHIGMQLGDRYLKHGLAFLWYGQTGKVTPKQIINRQADRQTDRLRYRDSPKRQQAEKDSL